MLLLVRLSADSINSIGSEVGMGDHGFSLVPHIGSDQSIEEKQSASGMSMGHESR